MKQQFVFDALNIHGEKQAAVIAADLMVHEGVEDVTCDLKRGKCTFVFEDSVIPSQKAHSMLESRGYHVANVSSDMSNIHETTYYVRGMHCASCELLIEEKLLELPGIKSVEASTAQGRVVVEGSGRAPKLAELNRLFARDGYAFSGEPQQEEKFWKRKGFGTAAIIAGVILAIFVVLNALGLSGFVNVTASSSLPTFFLFGLLAGVSSCAALVGGMILSLSKQWGELYPYRSSLAQKSEPHIMFQIGRLVSYALFGALLGSIGSKLQFSSGGTAWIIIVVSVGMLLLGLQMIGVKSLRWFQLAAPKFLTRTIAQKKKVSGRFMPFLLGAATFLLPCGFTITVQGLALLSGSPLQGALILFAFALGTAPTLLAIGLSSVAFSRKPDRAAMFSYVAGIIVFFFALYNINAQMNVLGLRSLSDISLKTSASTPETQTTKSQSLPPIENGKQILRMQASARGYTPSQLTVRVGVPVQWEIEDVGTGGCTSAIIAPALFSGNIQLTPGSTSVKEFTLSKPGRYKFSCWMGMISGVIEAVSS